MKKFIAVILALVLCSFIFVACNDQNQDGEGGATTPGATTTTAATTTSASTRDPNNTDHDPAAEDIF